MSAFAPPFRNPFQCRVVNYAGVILAVLGLAAPCLAKERLARPLDQTSGLVVPTVFSLVQDADGFLWIGTAGGLVRYDGDEMRPWAKDVINRDVFTLVSGPQGEVLVAEKNGTLYRVTAEGVEPISGPAGKYIEETLHAAFESSGNLWVVSAGGVVHVRDGK